MGGPGHTTPSGARSRRAYRAGWSRGCGGPAISAPYADPRRRRGCASLRCVADRGGRGIRLPGYPVHRPVHGLAHLALTDPVAAGTGRSRPESGRASRGRPLAASHDGSGRRAHRRAPRVPSRVCRRPAPGRAAVDVIDVEAGQLDTTRMPLAPSNSEASHGRAADRVAIVGGDGGCVSVAGLTRGEIAGRGGGGAQSSRSAGSRSHRADSHRPGEERPRTRSPRLPIVDRDRLAQAMSPASHAGPTIRLATGARRRRPVSLSGSALGNETSAGLSTRARMCESGAPRVRGSRDRCIWQEKAGHADRPDEHADGVLGPPALPPEGDARKPASTSASPMPLLRSRLGISGGNRPCIRPRPRPVHRAVTSDARSWSAPPPLGSGREPGEFRAAEGGGDDALRQIRAQREQWTDAGCASGRTSQTCRWSREPIGRRLRTTG